MPYFWKCARGHEHGPFNLIIDAKIARKELADGDDECAGKPGRMQHYSLKHRATATPDIPEHFNDSIGAPVRSRRHLKELQKAGGFQDHEPAAKPSSSVEYDVHGTNKSRGLARRW